MSSPILLIRRIVVEGDLYYDQSFHQGVNVIHSIQTNNDPRTVNKCGKTALVELIQHGLGRRQSSKAKFFFAPIINDIETLFLEIETPNGVYTIQRSLQAITGAAKLHEGPIVPGMKDSPAEIVSVEDLSGLLLGLLGIPAVAVKTNAGDLDPLSFPLLMRAFVLHQEDSFQEILFKVVPEKRKTDIIGLLTGIVPEEIYPIEKEISSVRKQLQPLETEIENISRFLQNNEVPTHIEAQARIRQAQEDLENAIEEQRSIHRLIIQNAENDQPGQIDQLRKNLMDVKQQIAEMEQTYFAVQQEEERLKELIASLRGDKRKSEHLQASTTQMSNVDFHICPRCLQDITPEMRQRELSSRCSLCNRSMIASSDRLPKRVRKTDDIDIQITEAEEIITSVEQEISTYEGRLSHLKEEEWQVSVALENQASIYVSPSLDRLMAQADVISEKKVELERARAIQEQAEFLEKMRSTYNDMRADLADLQDQLDAVNKVGRSKLEELRQSYESVLLDVGFPDVQSVSIDPSLLPSINDMLYIHQGTAFKGLASVCYHLALFHLACKESSYFPTCLIIDSPNSGDLNPENHSKLLKYIADLNEKPELADKQWQIILTTRQLVPDLEPFVCDEISNPDRMLLRRR